LAIGLIEWRLQDAFPGIEFEVHGTPKDFPGAEDGGKRKGADTGIDGYYFCKPDGKKIEAGIVSVKGGETVRRNAVGELRGVMEREHAPFAIMITLREPTNPMIREAASAGFFESSFGRFPRMRVVSAATLLSGTLPKLPPQERGGGYKRAERDETPQDRLL
jgi:site-specific DNA-methyltransferase (adenine-specific)